MQQLDIKDLPLFLKKNPTAVLIDVRENVERAQHHIGGIHIPLPEIVVRRQELPLNQPLIFYCKKGVRSQIAIQKLQAYLPNNLLYNLTGGIGS
jgi:rhodanese-related sulfurtransferase